MAAPAWLEKPLVNKYDALECPRDRHPCLSRTVEHGGPTGAREATPRCLQVQSRKRLTKTSEHPKKMGLSNVRAEAAPWSEDGLPDAVAGVATRRIFGSSSDQTQGARHLRVGVSASSVTTRTAGPWESWARGAADASSGLAPGGHARFCVDNGHAHDEVGGNDERLLRLRQRSRDNDGWCHSRPARPRRSLI